MEELTIDEKLAAQGVALSNASVEEKQAVLVALDKAAAAHAEQAAKIAELSAKVAELEQSPDAIKALTEQVTALETQLAAAKTELSNAAGLLAAEASKPKAEGFGEITVNKKRYEITASAVIVPGKGKVTAADILKDKDLQATLLEIGCGTLKELK